MIQTRRDAHGIAFHVSCHSMASVARNVSKDAGAQRSDFDSVDGYGKTCDAAFVEAAVECLTGLGYNVTVNKHFAGAESIHKHGDPKVGVYSLQIEARRGLYMDEATYAKRTAFEKVRSDLGTLCGALAAFARSAAA